jgi:hypothetical protein
MPRADDVFKDVQERLEGPPPVHVRNINIDTHIGDAPQRPYAILEDHLASVADGYRDFAALSAALKGAPEPAGLPPGAPNPNEIVERPDGWVRYVVSGEPRDRYVNDRGQVMERVRFTPRYVALSISGARAADSPDRPTDFWNGFTWLRGGYKPERDFAVMTQQALGPENEPLVFDMPASSTDVAVLHHEMRRADAARPSLPVEATPSERRTSKKED